MAKPILGGFTRNILQDPLKVAQTIGKEQVLKQSGGADFYQVAVVVQIDPIGGQFGDNDQPIGSPRYSIRARIMNQSGDGANADMFRDTDELKVYYPFDSNYHDHKPIKKGEKVWVFELEGLGGITQRYWCGRVNSPSPLSLEPFVRPNNNYCDAAFEMNIGRETPIDANVDRLKSDTIDRVAQRSPGAIGELEDPDSARSHYSRVDDENAALYGFVNEYIPEWFFRPSDRVIQGSNNSGILFGTNAVTIESEDEEPDISDIISIFGASNDASDFSNAKDRDVIRADRAPIAAGAEPKTANAHLVAGRRYSIQSYTFDASRLSVFENAEIDNIAPLFSQVMEILKAPAAANGPSMLMRSTNIRTIARNSIAMAMDNGAGLYMDVLEEGRLLGNFPRLLRMDIGETFLEMDGTQKQIQLNAGNSFAMLNQTEAGLNAFGNYVKATATGVEISGALLSLAFSQLSIPSVIVTAGGVPVNFSGGVIAGSVPLPVANQGTMQGLATIYDVQGDALIASGLLAPVGTAFKAVAAGIRGLPLSTKLLG